MARNRPDPEEDDLVTEQFRTFLDELVKAQARFSELPDADPDLAAQGLSRHLLNLLEIQTLQSRRESTRFEMETVADARYLKAVLADEILLNTEWAGRERWTAYLLESTLFRTNVAGDLVFRRVEQLLSEREPRGATSRASICLRSPWVFRAVFAAPMPLHACAVIAKNSTSSSINAAPIWAAATAYWSRRPTRTRFRMSRPASCPP